MCARRVCALRVCVCVQALGCKVVLPQQYYDTLGLLNDPELLASAVFTTDPTQVPLACMCMRE